MAALEDEFPDARGEEQKAFLLNNGDALRAGSRRERVSDESIEKNPAGKGREGAGDQFQEGGFAAGVGAEDGYEFAGLGLKAGGLQREEGGLRGIRGIGIADLLDAQAGIDARARCLAWIARETRSPAHEAPPRRT